jgi:hypothetical protein
MPKYIGKISSFAPYQYRSEGGEGGVQLPLQAAKLARKGDCGVRVRILLGDPESNAMAVRGAEEGVFGAVAAQIRLSLLDHYMTSFDKVFASRGRR